MLCCSSQKHESCIQGTEVTYTGISVYMMLTNGRRVRITWTSCISWPLHPLHIGTLYILNQSWSKLTKFIARVLGLYGRDTSSIGGKRVLKPIGLTRLIDRHVCALIRRDWRCESTDNASIGLGWKTQEQKTQVTVSTGVKRNYSHWHIWQKNNTAIRIRTKITHRVTNETQQVSCDKQKTAKSIVFIWPTR